MMTEQLTIERTSNAPLGTGSAPPTTLKTVLVHIENHPTLDRLVEAGLALARAASAHLSCVHVTYATPIQTYISLDRFGGICLMNDIHRTLEENNARLRSRIESKLESEDVTWDFGQLTGDIATKISGQAALADLVVASRTAHKDEFAAPAIGLLGDLLFRCRTPIFIPGDQESVVDPTGEALIAWDGSHEAANAVRSSLGLLKLAHNVEVIEVPERKDDAFPGTRLLEYLSRQGIHAELAVAGPPAERSDHDVVAATLVAHARAAQASYMVMGGYSHSRLGEYVFGGVTRALLKDCPVPIVIAR